MHRSAFARVCKVAPALLRKRARRVDRRRRRRARRARWSRPATSARRSARRGRRSRRCSTTTRSTRTRSATRASSCRASARRTSRRRSPSTSSGSPRCCARHYVAPASSSSTSAGPRVSELETAQVGDLDEHRRAIRVRWTVEKNDRYRHLELPDDLFAAILGDAAAARGPRPRGAAVPRADRRARCGRRSPAPARRPGRRTSRRTACAAGAARCTTSGPARWPTSPSCSGDSKRVAADHYVYALTDYREVDRSIALARARS